MSSRKEIDKTVNWLGQEIKKGTPVYRGARDGNSSSFKVGVVKAVYVKEEHGGSLHFTAKVEWAFEPGVRWDINKYENYVRRIASVGYPSIDSIVVIDVDTYLRLDKVAQVR